MLDGEVTLTAPDAAQLRSAVQMMQEVLEGTPAELQQRMRSSETAKKLAEKVPQVAEVLSKPVSERALAELQAALAQMAAALQDPQASAQALEQVALARAELAALGPEKLAQLSEEFPVMQAIGLIGQGVPAQGEEPAKPRALAEMAEQAAAFQVPSLRAGKPQMGARKPVAKKAPGLKPKGSLNRRAISFSKDKTTYIDVSGQEYQDVSAFKGQFDEIGVLPPIGRWDPLKIREQGPERYRRFVEMEIKR